MDNVAYSLLDYVCRSVSYKSDDGEWWEFPSETLATHQADCDGSAILLCSLLRNFYPPDRVYVVVGTYRGLGHAWCFPGDTKIICLESGRYKPIEIGNLQKFSGIEALSYNFRTKSFESKSIIGFACQGVKPVVKVSLIGAAPIRCTPNHPFPVKWGNRYAVRQIDKISQDSHSRKILIAKEIPSLNALEIRNEQLALEGIFAAEGSKTTTYQKTNYQKVRITNTDTSIIATITQNLRALRVSYSLYWQTDSRGSRKPCCHVAIGKSLLKDTFSRMGGNHNNKHFLEDRLSCSKPQARIIIDNFAKGDGYNLMQKDCLHSVPAYTTTSKDLAWQLAFLHRLLGERMYIQETSKCLKLIGRMDTYRKYLLLPSLMGREVKNMCEDGQDEIYDIEVADNHNFVLADSFALTHNCELDGEILETTYTNAHTVPDPQNYHAFAKFNDQETVEVWPRAMTQLFQLARNESQKLTLMAEATGNEVPPECPSLWLPLVVGMVMGGILGTGFAMILQKGGRNK